MEVHGITKLLNNFLDKAMMHLLVDVALIATITAILYFLFRSIFNKNQMLIKYYQEDSAKDKNKALIYLEFLDALQSAFYVCLWLYGITVVIESICIKIEFSKVIIIEKVRCIVIAVILCSSAIKAMAVIEKRYLIHGSQDESINQYQKMVCDLLLKAMKLLLIVITGLVIMHELGISVATLVSLGGVSGLVLGFSSKDLLSNFFGTLMIYLDNPFIVGDEIRVNSNTGIVEKIDLRMTTLRQQDMSLLYIPNSIFSTAFIINLSRISHKIFSEEMTILYIKKESIEAFIETLHTLLKEYKEIDSRHPITVEILKIYDDSIVIKVNCLCSIKKKKDFLIFKNRLLFDMVNTVEKNGLKVESNPIYVENQK